MTEPLTDDQLRTIEADITLAASGPMIGVPRGAERYEAWVRIGDKHGAALLAEVERLTTENRTLRGDEDQLIGERDRAQDAADKLAYAIAPTEVIGEHSDMNDPWDNAHEELHRQRQELADTVMMRDFNQRSAEHIAAKRDLAEAAIASWDRGEISGDAAVLMIRKALASGEGGETAPAARCTCARSWGLHAKDCALHIPGHDLAEACQVHEFRPDDPRRGRLGLCVDCGHRAGVDCHPRLPAAAGPAAPTTAPEERP